MKCSYFECDEDNWSTAFLTVDTYGTRWFCDEHWNIMGLLFNIVVPRCIKTSSCKRNYKVELNPLTTITTVKHNNKFYELCDKHNDMYEELLGINGLFGYD